VNLILKIPGLSKKKPLTPLPVGAVPGTLAIDPDAPKPQVSVIAYGPDALVEASIGNIQQLREYLSKYPVTWVNVDGLGSAETIQQIAEIFGIHPLAQEDILNLRHRPKLEEFDDQMFVVTRMAGLGEHFEYEQLSLFLGSNYVLTLQQHPGDCLDPVRQRLRQKRGMLKTYGADYLAYVILDAIIDGYFPVLDEYGERLDALEDEILERPKQGTILKVQAAKRDMLALRRSIWPQRELLSTMVRDPSPLITERTQVYLRDAYDHAIRIMDLVDTYREISSGLTDLYMSSVSNRMNDVMKMLTVIATIFIPLTFIAGIYGMNFNTEVSPFNMPELNWYWAYPVFWVVLVTISVVSLAFFKRKGWIGSDDRSAS
jgi:magnesium transporter